MKWPLLGFYQYEQDNWEEHIANMNDCDDAVMAQLLGAMQG